MLATSVSATTPAHVVAPLNLFTTVPDPRHRASVDSLLPAVLAPVVVVSLAVLCGLGLGRGVEVKPVAVVQVLE